MKEEDIDKAAKEFDRLYRIGGILGLESYNSFVAGANFVLNGYKAASKEEVLGSYEVFLQVFESGIDYWKNCENASWNQCEWPDKEKWIERLRNSLNDGKLPIGKQLLSKEEVSWDEVLEKWKDSNTTWPKFINWLRESYTISKK